MKLLSYCDLLGCVRCLPDTETLFRKIIFLLSYAAPTELMQINYLPAINMALLRSYLKDKNLFVI